MASDRDRTILDEATEALSEKCWPCWSKVPHRHDAAVVLRVASDRLRACADERDTKDCQEPPWHDAMDRAADLLREGTDRE